MRKGLLVLTFLAFCPLLIAQQSLNNDSIVKLVKAGLSDDLIISTINASAGTYNTSADGIIALKTAGTSDKVVAAIVTKVAAPATSAPGTPESPKPTRSSDAAPAEPVQADAHPQPPVAGSRVFVAPMEGNLDGFISAEILKQKLPLVVVTSDAQADLVMTGLNLKQDDHWYNAAWGGKDKNEGSVKLIGVHNKAVIWAGDAGDRSLLFSFYRRGGLSKVAERLVKQMQKDLSLKR
jgi:hypothetical protein